MSAGKKSAVCHDIHFPNRGAHQAAAPVFTMPGGCLGGLKISFVGTTGVSSADASGFSSTDSTGFSSADTAGLSPARTTGSCVPRTWRVSLHTRPLSSYKALEFTQGP